MLKLFTKVSVRKDSHLVDSDSQAFDSQSAKAFDHCFARRWQTFQFGGKRVDMHKLPKLSEWFGKVAACEEMSSGDERDPARSAKKRPNEAASGSGGAPVHSTVAWQRGTLEEGSLNLGALSDAGDPVTQTGGAFTTPQKEKPAPSPMCKSELGVLDSDRAYETGDDGKSCADESEAPIDLLQVPAQLEDACEFWIKKMPLDSILRGRKLGHAIRQGGELVERSLGDEKKSACVSSLRLHVRLAGIAKTLSPGKKFVERLSDAELRENAQALLDAQVALPLHVHEQFLFRYVAELKYTTLPRATDQFCEKFVEAVTPWQQASPSDTHRFVIGEPRLCDFVATQASKCEAFKKLFVNELLVPLLMKEESAKSLLHRIVKHSIPAFESTSGGELDELSMQVLMETLGALRGLLVVMDPLVLLTEFAALSDLRALKDHGSNTASRTISAKIGAAMLGNEHYSRLVQDLLKTETSSLKVQDSVRRTVEVCSGDQLLNEAKVETLSSAARCCRSVKPP